MCINNLNNIKKSIIKENNNFQFERTLKLFKELGQCAEKFNIIDEKMMTFDDIELFDLAIKTGIPGRPPKEKQIKKPTLGDKYEIRWKYDLREGITGPKILPDDRTRPFCEEIIRANRFYSREDISKLSNGIQSGKQAVFKYCGGYYTNPETGETTPYCRHAWYMIFVEKK